MISWKVFLCTSRIVEFLQKSSRDVSEPEPVGDGMLHGTNLSWVCPSCLYVSETSCSFSPSPMGFKFLFPDHFIAVKILWKLEMQ